MKTAVKRHEIPLCDPVPLRVSRTRYQSPMRAHWHTMKWDTGRAIRVSGLTPREGLAGHDSGALTGAPLFDRTKGLLVFEHGIDRF